MKYRLAKTQVKQLIKHRNGYLALSGLSLTLNILLVLLVFVTLGKSRIVVVPPIVDKPFWLTQNKVSPEYLSSMALFLSGLRLNITPSNADNQRQWLLRYVNSSEYNDLKAELLSEEEEIKKSHITTAFFPVDVKVDSVHLMVRLIGDKETTIGTMHLPIEHLTYQMTFRLVNGQLQIKSFAKEKVRSV